MCVISTYIYIYVVKQSGKIALCILIIYSRIQCVNALSSQNAADFLLVWLAKSHFPTPPMLHLSRRGFGVCRVYRV